MSEQYELFDETRGLGGLRLTPSARLTDPETSVEASGMDRAGRYNLRQEVLDVLLRHPDGLTDYEIATIVDRHVPTVGKRRGELVQLGAVGWTGHYRISPLGARCRVWGAIV